MLTCYLLSCWLYISTVHDITSLHCYLTRASFTWAHYYRAEPSPDDLVTNLKMIWVVKILNFKPHSDWPSLLPSLLCDLSYQGQLMLWWHPSSTSVMGNLPYAIWLKYISPRAPSSLPYYSHSRVVWFIGLNSLFLEDDFIIILLSA